MFIVTFSTAITNIIIVLLYHQKRPLSEDQPNLLVIACAISNQYLRKMWAVLACKGSRKSNHPSATQFNSSMRMINPARARSILC